MNINELFKEIQDYFFPDDLKGEFILHGNCIVWTYDLNDENVIMANNDGDNVIMLNNNEDDELSSYDFDVTSSEESLQEAYDKDIILLEEFLDSINESENWSFSEPDIYEDTISFRIF